MIWFIIGIILSFMLGSVFGFGACAIIMAGKDIDKQK